MRPSGVMFENKNLNTHVSIASLSPTFHQQKKGQLKSMFSISSSRVRADCTAQGWFSSFVTITILSFCKFKLF